MGWSGGNDIVERTIRAMQRAIDDEVLDSFAGSVILGILVDECRNLDWDTECETLGLFRNKLWIIEGFARAGVTPDDEEDEP